jgi:uncharacterized protein (TIGR02246 family)
MTGSAEQRHAEKAEEGAASPTELFGRLTDTWGAGDASGYAALFMPDADYVTYDGTRLHGRDEIRDAHQSLFDKFLRGSSLLWSDTGMRVVAPGAVVLHACGAVIMRWQRTPKPRRKRLSTITLLAVRSGDQRWLLSTFQNTRYRPFANTLMGRVLARRQPGN